MFTYSEHEGLIDQWCDVLIVGAGPTGLALAASLQLRGLSPLILDRQEEGANTSRAAVIHARTLEVLEPLGVVGQMLQEGVRVPIFRVRDEKRVLMSISFADLPTKFPFTLMYPQNRTESLLLSAFHSAGGVVHRPCEVIDIQSLDAGAEVVYRKQGVTNTVRTRWVVGCDGSHSVVRQQTGIPFEGNTYVEDFVLADVEMNWPLSREEVTLFFSPEGLVVVAPLPDNRFRIVATVQEASDEPTQADLQRILDIRCSSAGRGIIEKMIWTSRFHVSHRVVSQMKKGPVLLAGDAAHVHSPAGGQGMNTGIQDALALADALESATRASDGRARDGWAEDRLKVAQSVVQLSDRITRVATLSSTYGRVIRNAVLDVAGHVPAVQHLLARLLSELNYRP